MSTLADLPQLVGFFSYSRDDDEAFSATLSALRKGIERELSALLGRSKRDFHLWQDQTAISPGEMWELKIKAAVSESYFFIPIVSPRSVNSKYCKQEFELFLAREDALGRNDLVFPILYLPVASLEDESKWRHDPVLSIIGQRQYVDWRALRHLDVEHSDVRKQIERFCEKIVGALNKPWVTPEERQRLAQEEEARKQAEAKRQAQKEKARRQAEAEAKRQADEEQLRRRAELEAQQETEKEEARKLAELNAKRQADEQEAQRRAAVEVQLRAEEQEAQRRAEAEARKQAEETKKRAEVVRWAEAAVRGGDVAELNAFLKANPNGVLADKVRDRLKSLEPHRKMSTALELLLLTMLALFLFGVVLSRGS